MEESKPSKPGGEEEDLPDLSNMQVLMLPECCNAGNCGTLYQYHNATPLGEGGWGRGGVYTGFIEGYGAYKERCRI